MRVGKLSNNIWLLYRVCECHRLACGCRRCWCAGGGLSGRCVRSVLLLLLLARHPRSADCCAAVGRAKRKGRKERKGNRGVAVRRGEERPGWALRNGEQRLHVDSCHFTSPMYARMDTWGKKASWTRTRSDELGSKNDSRTSLSLKVTLVVILNY